MNCFNSAHVQDNAVHCFNKLITNLSATTCRWGHSWSGATRWSLDFLKVEVERSSTTIGTLANCLLASRNCFQFEISLGWFRPNWKMTMWKRLRSRALINSNRQYETVELTWWEFFFFFFFFVSTAECFRVSNVLRNTSNTACVVINVKVIDRSHWQLVEQTHPNEAVAQSIFWRPGRDVLNWRSVVKLG